MVFVSVLTLVISMVTLYVILKIAFTLQGAQEKIMAGPIGKLLAKFG